MGVKRKLVSQMNIRCHGGEDVFRPFKYANILPTLISSGHISIGDLLAGHWGTVGAVFTWSFVKDGEKKVVTDVIEAVDDEKKSITYKAIEGELLESVSSSSLSRWILMAKTTSLQRQSSTRRRARMCPIPTRLWILSMP